MRGILEFKIHSDPLTSRLSADTVAVKSVNINDDRLSFFALLGA